MDFVYRLRVDEIQSATRISNICQQYRLKERVRPDSLVENLFTTTATDNIDHDDTFSTSFSHFHGTSISVFQHYANLIEKENITYSFGKADYERSIYIVQELQIPCSSVLLPLINESIDSTAMVKHCITVIQKVVHKANPGQISIITADQPVYALHKQIQWKFLHDFGEDTFIIMMGGLHIEMTMLHVLGLVFLGPKL